MRLHQFAFRGLMLSPYGRRRPGLVPFAVAGGSCLVLSSQCFVRSFPPLSTSLSVTSHAIPSGPARTHTSKKRRRRESAIRLIRTRQALLTCGKLPHLLWEGRLDITVLCYETRMQTCSGFGPSLHGAVEIKVGCTALSLFVC